MIVVHYLCTFFRQTARFFFHGLTAQAQPDTDSERRLQAAATGADFGPAT